MKIWHDRIPLLKNSRTKNLTLPIFSYNFLLPHHTANHLLVHQQKDIRVGIWTMIEENNKFVKFRRNMILKCRFSIFTWIEEICIKELMWRKNQALTLHKLVNSIAGVVIKYTTEVFLLPFGFFYMPYKRNMCLNQVPIAIPIYNLQDCQWTNSQLPKKGKKNRERRHSGNK